MTERDQTARDGDGGAHPGALGAAVLRIGASPDLDTVLRETVDAPRALTGAACGAIATVDAAGRPGDFVTSGLTEDEHRVLETWSDGPGPFAHLAGIAAPLRPVDPGREGRGHRGGDEGRRRDAPAQARRRRQDTAPCRRRARPRLPRARDRRAAILPLSGPAARR